MTFFFVMATMKILFGIYTVSITTCYAGLWHKMYMLCFYQYISVFEWKQYLKWREMVLAPFRKRNSFNNLRKDEKFSINLVNFMLNTLLTLELANVSKLFTPTSKHYHTRWSPNIIQWIVYEAILKYVIQSL